MTTAADIIYSAREYATIARQGEVISGALADSHLKTLNTMLDGWRPQRLFAYRIREESFTWAASQQSRTVGSGGNFATDRPVKVDDSTVFRRDDIDYGVMLIDADEWASLTYKQMEAEIPTHLYPEQGASLLTLYAYPIPSASITLVLKSWQLVQSFTDLTTTLTLPPGYQHAIETSLGELLCIKGGKSIPPELRDTARLARGTIKAVNMTVPRVEVEVGHFKGSSASIITG